MLLPNILSLFAIRVPSLPQPLTDDEVEVDIGAGPSGAGEPVVNAPEGEGPSRAGGPTDELSGGAN